MDKKPERGRDISRPMDSMTVGGVEYPLAFDLNAFRVAEDIYELQYGRSLNFGEIVQQLAAGKIGAVLAVLYGAIVSGAESAKKAPSWEDFRKAFRLTDLPGASELIQQRVKDALPDAENPPAPPETAAET